ncbi:glycosyltransferase family 2 protein [Citrifermentans bemidjiense]|uniref:glycosyltransferase family 2 protein n=1 Tax=Citrifermentans bemidjiense TaxID=225194 RepID=UPI001CF7CFF9|nr:glycosyltransferase family 2 protein [Citrifermentans bemidjiense]
MIPTYGRAQMVKQTVLAALNQELEPFEVIVSDDCSPDDTVQVLREVSAQHPRLKLIENATNSGGVPNWNKVIDAAQGDYIAYCSDDDYFLPYHLKTAVGFLEENREVDMVHSGFFNLTDTCRQFPIVSCALISDQVFVINGRKTLQHIIKQTSYPFQPSTWVFRRTLWEAVGHFDTRYSVSDTDWFIQAGLSHSIAYLPVCTVVNRRHPDNWSNRVGSINMNLEFHDMMRRALQCCAQRDEAGLGWLVWQWKLTEFVKFLRIYVARSRAGMFDVSEHCADVLWDFMLSGRRTNPYPLYAAFTKRCSRILRRVQLLLPGGEQKYLGSGTDCPG